MRYALDKLSVHRKANKKRQTTIHAHFYTYGQFRQVNKACMSVDCRRKPEYLERAHLDTVRTCKLHTERPCPSRNRTKDPLDVRRADLASDPGPSCCKAKVLTSKPQCCPCENQCFQKALCTYVSLPEAFWFLQNFPADFSQVCAVHHRRIA